jgi:hypothetical protein
MSVRWLLFSQKCRCMTDWRNSSECPQTNTCFCSMFRTEPNTLCQSKMGTSHVSSSIFSWRNCQFLSQIRPRRTRKILYFPKSASHRVRSSFTEARRTQFPIICQHFRKSKSRLSVYLKLALWQLLLNIPKSSGSGEEIY